MGGAFSLVIFSLNFLATSKFPQFPKSQKGIYECKLLRPGENLENNVYLHKMERCILSRLAQGNIPEAHCPARFGRSYISHLLRADFLSNSLVSDLPWNILGKCFFEKTVNMSKAFYCKRFNLLTYNFYSTLLITKILQC